jgi:type IV secretion system protein VirB2
MIAAVIQQASLADAPPTGVISAAASWVSGLLFGPLATTIAIIAIAWIGLAMLSGRIDIRRGLAVVFGCFLLFGAWGIAEGLQSSAMNEAAPMVVGVPPQPNYAKAVPSANTPNGYDPYAGAAVMRPTE